MDAKTRIIAGLYFFIFLCVYAGHNFMQKMNKDLNHIKEGDHGLFDILCFVKFIGAFVLSNIADRTGKYGHIIAIGIGGYVLFMYLMFNGHGYNSDGGYFVLIAFYRTLSIFFLSGVFPVLDVICLEHLDGLGKLREWYGRIRISSCVGHSFGTLSVKYGTQMASSFSKPAVPLSLTCLFGIGCLIYVWVVFNFLSPEKKISKKTESIPLHEKFQIFYRNCKEILTLDFVLLLTAILLQGIHRQAISTYQETFCSNIGIPRGQMSTIFAVRCLPEAIMLFITPYFEKAIGIYWMFFLAIIFGFSRPLTYAVIPTRSLSEIKITIMVYSIEILKGIFSALFSYSASKIVKELNSSKNKSTAQGIYNGCYSGLAPMISGILCNRLYKISNPRIGSVERLIFLVTGILGASGLFFVTVLAIRRKTKIAT